MNKKGYLQIITYSYTHNITYFEKRQGGVKMILGEDDLKIYGARVEAARKEKGLTQEELAERVGVSQAMINFIEKGKKKPSLDKAIAIARELDTTVDRLIPRV